MKILYKFEKILYKFIIIEHTKMHNSNCKYSLLYIFLRFNNYYILLLYFINQHGIN